MVKQTVNLKPGDVIVRPCSGEEDTVVSTIKQGSSVYKVFVLRDRKPSWFYSGAFAMHELKG